VSDRHERAFPATPRRLEKARREGDVPRALIAPAALAIASVAVPWALLPQLAAWWEKTFACAAVAAAAVGRGPFDVAATIASASGASDPTPWTIVLSAWAGSSTAAAAAAVAVGALGISAGALRADIGRLSWSKGFASIVSSGSLAATAMGCTAAAALVALAWRPASDVIRIAAMSPSLRDEAAAVTSELASLWRGATGALLALAVIDVWLARRRHSARLRMTLREVKDERAEHEGRPEVRARRRAIGARRSRRLRLAAIKSATAVVTNPTHYAIALRYAPPEIDVPIVVSSGAGIAAALVRTAAAYHGVPMVEAPVLARMLFERADLDEPIPEELYAGVAAVFAWIVRTYGALGGAS
jgi:flagellar biosynthesis protein FlhB